MNDTRFEAKVGVFVAASLALAALLILNFSKGPMVFRSTYKLHIKMPTVAGLKSAADVMMAGVPIGKVVKTDLSQDGRSVDITVEVLAKYEIRKNAAFHIDSEGFLGDSYVEITPAEVNPKAPAEAPLLTNGETVTGDEPFNLQEAVRSISGVVDQGKKTMNDLDTSINNINSSILAGVTLSNLVATLNNFRSVSADAVGMAKDVRVTLDADLPPVHTALTNFQALSVRLNVLADKLDQTITTNSGDFTAAIKNINATASDLRQLADGLQAGQGLAGGILKDEKMKTDFSTLVTNISSMADEFGRFAERLNQESLWHVLVSKPKPTNAAAH
jgi:phospholipid/cholesterol/gamma-HCH transport system substrate-binding protein